MLIANNNLFMDNLTSSPSKSKLGFLSSLHLCCPSCSFYICSHIYISLYWFNEKVVSKNFCPCLNFFGLYFNKGLHGTSWSQNHSMVAGLATVHHQQQELQLFIFLMALYSLYYVWNFLDLWRWSDNFSANQKMCVLIWQ